MKTTFVLYAATLYIIFSIPCMCQTHADPPSISYLNGLAINDSVYHWISGLHGTNGIYLTNVNINFNDTTIFAKKQKSFALGHQWGSAKKGVNKRLGMNMYNENLDYPNFADSLYNSLPDDTTKESYVIWKQPFYLERFPGLSMQFDPEAPLFSSNGLFTPRSGDTTGAAFGFTFRDSTVGSIENSPTGANYTRYILRKDSIGADTAGGRMVLRYPAKNNALYTDQKQRQKPNINDTSLAYPYSLYKIDSTYYEEYYNRAGYRWYLTVNLQRLDAVDMLSNDDTVLTIKLPYWKFKDEFNYIDTGTIRFDSVFMKNGSTLDTMRTNRGLMDNHLTADPTRTFVIRRNMLPVWKADGSHDITLSAFFTCDTVSANSDTTNPQFHLYNGSGSSLMIDSLGMEVKYFGRTNVGIDWIRLETVDSRLLFRGNLDSTFAQDIMRITAILKKRNDSTNKKVRISSFYHHDEIGGHPVLWRAVRYRSKLLEGLSTSEGSTSSEYQHVTGQRTYWGSMPAYKNHSNVSFIKYGGIWGYKMGLDGFESQKFSTEGMKHSYLTDGSAYELYSSVGGGNTVGWKPYVCSVKGIKDYYNDNSLNGYRDFDAKYNILTTNTPSVLAKFDRDMYETYRLYKDILYGGKAWWGNYWIMTEWETEWIDSINSMQIKGAWYCRPQTGEEYRQIGWMGILLGAKGFMYDRFYSNPSLVNINDTSASVGSDSTYRKNEKARYNSTANYAHHGATAGYIGISSAIVEHDSSGNYLLYNDASGSDFLHTGDFSNIYQYCNLGAMANAFGVDTNRLYIGRKSTRLEVMKLHDKINSYGDTLMRLQLMGWYGKGLRELISMKNNDTTLLTKFLLLDSNHVKTRPILRDYPDGWDTTFCDFAIHRDTSISMDTTFYVAVLNRRTNPLIRPIGDTSLRFYTTFEFDSLTLGGDSLWRSQRYNQGGSREITIPFNYHDTLGRYAMLHVKELGGGIDTIIGQDSPLAVKFLPGEGKMFNVTILHPDAGVAGRLQYSNQRKMVGYPIPRSDGTPSDSVYYHLTYHRYDSIAARNSVYYRRSNPVWYNSSSENVAWQSEKTLSQYIRASKCDGDTIMRLDCAYPSLIVRYDSADSMNKVYVVYSCVAPFIADSCNPSGKQLIAENVLNADADDSTYIADTAQVFNTYRGIMSEYGNPMVNASAHGNYYCWSDSTVGIVVGWKPPHARALTDSKPLSWGAANGGQTLGCKHPSMNSYSRISLGESDCALVWEELINTPIINFGTLQRTHIFYTRLKMIEDTAIHHFLSPSFFTTGESVSKSSDGKIARMSTGAWSPNAHRLPSVYRDLVDSVVSGSTISKQRDSRTDCLVWSAQEYSVIANPPLYAMANLNDIIYRRTAWINDSSSVPTVWGVGGLCRIWNSGSFLENPSVSQGISKIYTTGLFSVNESDSAVLMSINEYTSTLSGTLNKLWHIRGNINYLYTGQDTSVAGYYNDGLAKIVNTNGEYGQTAAFPVVGGASTWRKNRRIYQADSASSHIQMSPQYFLKASDNDEQIGFTGFSGEESKYMLSNPFLNGTMLKFNRVRQEQLSNEKRVRYYDRISTDWFTVGETESLWLKSVGKNSELVLAFVERRSDGARFPVELGVSDDTTALWTPIHLRRGGTEEYRFFILKRLTDENNRAITESSYGEEMVLHGIKTAISSQKMGANGIQEIDLGRDVNVGASIRVYPNPAREKVTVVVTDTNQKNTWHVKVMNVLGTILSVNDSKPNTSIEIVTEDYPTGIYYITAESEKMSTRTRFVIMR